MFVIPFERGMDTNDILHNWRLTPEYMHVSVIQIRSRCLSTLELQTLLNGDCQDITWVS